MPIFVILFLLAVLFWGQMLLFGKKAFQNFEYRCDFDCPEAFEGDEIELIEQVYNRKWVPLPWFKTEITTSRWLEFAGSQSIVTYNTRFVPSFFLVKSYQKVTRRWKVKCLKRGVFPIESVILVSTDLLGQKVVSQKADISACVTVLPQTVDLDQMFVSARYLQGDNPVRNQLIPDPFYVSGVREYQPSDPMKNIHWNATAKLGRIMIRNMEYTTRQSITVVLNMQSRQFEQGEAIDQERMEQCIRVAATLLEETLENSIPVSLASNASLEGKDKETFESSQNFGREHILELLHTLANFPKGSSLDFPSYLGARGEIFPSTDIQIVTPYLCDEIYDYARAAIREDKRVTIFLVGFPSANMPDDIEINILKELAVLKDETDDGFQKEAAVQ